MVRYTKMNLSQLAASRHCKLAYYLEPQPHIKILSHSRQRLKRRK